MNLDAQMIHGDIEQKTREKTLQAFRDGKVKCLVATDVAARGLDIPEIDLVIQTAPPSDIDSYIHRSGRTGRAGRTGTCICLYKPQQVNMSLFLIGNNYLVLQSSKSRARSRLQV